MFSQSSYHFMFLSSLIFRRKTLSFLVSSSLGSVVTCKEAGSVTPRIELFTSRVMLGRCLDLSECCSLYDKKGRDSNACYVMFLKRSQQLMTRFEEYSLYVPWPSLLCLWESDLSPGELSGSVLWKRSLLEIPLNGKQDRFPLRVLLFGLFCCLLLDNGAL